jgi:hypothetical protein
MSQRNEKATTIGTFVPNSKRPQSYLVTLVCFCCAGFLKRPGFSRSCKSEAVPQTVCKQTPCGGERGTRGVRTPRAFPSPTSGWKVKKLKLQKLQRGPRVRCSGGQHPARAVLSAS